CVALFLCCAASVALRALPSFPTRRSSDLRGAPSGGGAPRLPAGARGEVRERRAGADRRDQEGLAQPGPDPGRFRPARTRPRLCRDRKSTRLNSSHVKISYAVFCLKKKNKY